MKKNKYTNTLAYRSHDTRWIVFSLTSGTWEIEEGNRKSLAVCQYGLEENKEGRGSEISAVGDRVLVDARRWVGESDREGGAVTVTVTVTGTTDAGGWAEAAPAPALACLAITSSLVFFSGLINTT